MNRELLEQGRESAYSSFDLATIRTNAPINFEPKDAIIQPYNKKELYSLFVKLEFVRLIDKYSLRGVEAEAPVEANVVCECVNVLCGISDFHILHFGFFLSFFYDGCGHNLWCVIDLFCFIFIGRVDLVGYLFLIDAGALATLVLVIFGRYFLLCSGDGLLVKDAVDEILALK